MYFISVRLFMHFEVILSLFRTSEQYTQALFISNYNSSIGFSVYASFFTLIIFIVLIHND